MGFKDPVKQAKANREYKRKAKERKVFSGIVARGGDQHQPMSLAKPKLSVSELRRELNAHLKCRPSNLDIPAITEWARKKEALIFDIVRWAA